MSEEKLSDTSISIKYRPCAGNPYEVFWNETLVYGGLCQSLSEAKTFVTSELIPRLIEMGLQP